MMRQRETNLMLNIMEQFAATIVGHFSEEPFKRTVKKIGKHFINVIQIPKGNDVIWRNTAETIDVPSAVLQNAYRLEWIL